MTALSSAPPVWEDRSRSGDRARRAVWALLLVQAGALVMQATAIHLARHEHSHAANILSCCAFAAAFGSACWALLGRALGRTLRDAAVVCLGITSAVQWKMSDPVVHLGYDEQLHMRTLRDIESAHRIFEPQPLLAVSPRYPGLEALTALLIQVGLPLQLATIAVVLLARLVLIAALCAAVEFATGSARAGGLAVAAYAISPQFVFFNSQFSYQTLSLPLALSAVALVARTRHARSTQHAAALFCGASICLLAVAVTHHLTSLLVAVFLVGWALIEQPGRPRRRVALAAVIAVLVAALWATIQWSLLRDYFGPMISGIADELRLGHRREPFAELAGSPKSWWERGLLGYYAVVIVLTVGYLTVTRGRLILRARRRSQVDPLEPNVFAWRRQTLILGIAATIPMMFATRVVPRFGEVGDRASTFSYLAFSLLVAVGIERCYRRPTRGEPPGAKHRHRERCRYVLGACGIRGIATVLASGVFVGGYLLGSGAAWARLPGHYLPGADGRSVDAEMLAVADWAGNALPAGSRLAADRMTSTLLSSRAGLWPLSSQPDGLDLASLYQADEWGPPQTEMARRANLRYIFTDDRIANKKPYDLGYFDETTHVLLTPGQLQKFGSVPAVVQIYRHGPIGVYDLGGLGIPELRNGWTGVRSGPMGLLTQVTAGLALGICGALLGRSEIGRIGARAAGQFHSAAGSALTFASTVAALCVIAVVLQLSRIWLGTAFFGAASAAVLAMNPGWCAAGISKLRRPPATAVVLAAVVTFCSAAAIAVSVSDADRAHRLGAAESIPCSESRCHD